MKNFCKIIGFVFVAVLSTSCGEARYVNHKYRYSVNIPTGFVHVEAKNSDEQSKSMIARIEEEQGLPLYENVDAAFYKLDSHGPVFDSITICTMTKAFSMNQINNSKPVLEAYFVSLLSSTYSDVRMLRSEFSDFKIGKTYRTDYELTYLGVKCYAVVIILTSNPLYSSMITLICPSEHEAECSYSLREVVDSFKKR